MNSPESDSPGKSFIMNQAPESSFEVEVSKSVGVIKSQKPLALPGGAGNSSLAIVAESKLGGIRPRR